VRTGETRSIEGYSENHHILPECLGGADIPNNLVRLFPEEHYVAHQLLAKIFPKNYKLLSVAIAMTTDASGHRINNKLYAWIRREFALSLSIHRKGQNKTNCERVAKTSATMTGRTKETHKHLKDISDAKIGRTKETHEYLKIVGEKQVWH